MGALAAAPFVSFQSNKPLPDRARVVSRMTPEGLVPIEWSQIEAGDSLCVCDWKDGRIVRFTFCKAKTRPDPSKNGMFPCDFGGEDSKYVTVDCTSV